MPLEGAGGYDREEAMIRRGKYSSRRRRCESGIT